MNTVTDRKSIAFQTQHSLCTFELLHLQVEAAVSLRPVGEDSWHVAPVNCDSGRAVYILGVRKQRMGI